MEIKGILHRIHTWKEAWLKYLVINFWPRWISPNMLTLSRIILAGVIAWMLFDYGSWRKWIIFFFTLGLLSDLLDGAVARNFNKTNARGTGLDPLADKLLLVPLFLYLLKNSPYLMWAIVAMEGFLIPIAIVVIILKIEAPANIWGKTKMTFQAAGLFTLLVLGNLAAGAALLWISIGLGVGSMLGHINAFLQKS
jgi:phosphatidylglycerophosphate synthase